MKRNPDLPAFSVVAERKQYAGDNDYESAANLSLLSSPVDLTGRIQLRVRLPFAPKKLETLTRKFLSRSPMFAPGYVPILARPLPRYADWLREALRPRVLTANPPRIPGEDVEWTTANYVACFERMNNLKESA